MEPFQHTDADGDRLTIGPTVSHDGLWVESRGPGDGMTLLDPAAIRRLYDYLGRWLNVTPAPPQAPADPVTMTGLVELFNAVVRPLHQSPVARYVDAYGRAAEEIRPQTDPEPRDVGHPEVVDVTENCDLIRPLHASRDDRCSQCGFRWLDHRAVGEVPECTACGHAYRSHFAGGCFEFTKCECTRYRSTR